MSSSAHKNEGSQVGQEGNSNGQQNQEGTPDEEGEQNQNGGQNQGIQQRHYVYSWYVNYYTTIHAVEYKDES